LPKTAALLVAAGLSTRMGSFKPLLNLAGRPLVVHAADVFDTENIAQIVIVIGYRGDEIEAVLKNRKILFIRNTQYAQTDMFDSIKIGLKHLQDQCDRFFVMPADIPCVSRNTIKTMCEFTDQQAADVLYPAVDGKLGHPVLIDAKCIARIIDHQGPDGLRGALNTLALAKQIIEVADPGILLDADTPDKYEIVKNYYDSIHS
jgi:molybdenum cofactor cytidylyltransferase